MNLVLMGPPGTGKGTIARFIQERFKFQHLSAGDLLRTEVKNGTEIGKKAEPLMNEGKLVPDDLVAQVIAAKLNGTSGKGFVLDGYPRNFEQAKILDKILGEKDVSLDLVLDVESSEKEIVKRLSSRRQCPVCGTIYGSEVPPKKEGICDNDGTKLVHREDDKPEVIKYRYRLYLEMTKDLAKYYNTKGILVVVDGNRHLPPIFAEIEKIIQSKQGKA